MFFVKFYRPKMVVVSVEYAYALLVQWTGAVMVCVVEPIAGIIRDILSKS
jgi:hypothetical protein